MPHRAVLNHHTRHKMHTYRTRAVDRLFKKNEQRLKENVRKLILTTGYYISDPEEMLQEMCILFYKNFAEFYEDDRQYLSFLFICMKNKIRNHQRKEYTNINRFTTDLNSLRSHTKTSAESDSGQTISYSNIWGQVKDPHCVWTRNQMIEIVEKAKHHLNSIEIEVYTLIVEEGEFINEISEIHKLRKLPKPTPSQKSRLTTLEKKPGLCGMCLKETVDLITYSIKPAIVSFMAQEGLCRYIPAAIL